MNYNDFLTRQQQIKKLSIAEQKNFYEQLLKKKYDKTEVRILASFYYGQLFYQEGNFRKTIEIIEPIIVDYQSYPYTPKLLSCFNLIGVATHCETEYNVSRFFYETALKIAMENDEKYYYAFEYNNIALTYIEEQNYEEALKSLTLAEDVLKDCDEEMGAYIYINKSISLQKLNRLTEALKAFELGVSQYHADTIVPDDVTRCAATLYYKLEQPEKYETYKKQILSKMDEMYAAEFMDACRELFECGRDSCDDNLMNHILRSMNQYMEKYPDEIKVGLEFAELIYVYAVGKMDKDAILEALEAKNYYKDRIIEYSKENHIKSLQQYIEINSQISELERDALTGFKTRKAYYKDIAIIECDEEMCNQPVGIAFADVNGLKKINDNLGHEAGDELLAAIAKKIITIFQEAGCYRFGGDEFIILSFDKSETDFQNKLQKLSKLWTAECSASIGSVWLEHAKDIEKNLSVADEKMYVNKNYYYKLLLDCGFVVQNHYTSNIYPIIDMDYYNEKFEKRYEQFLNKGYEIKSPAKKNYPYIMEKVYELIMDLYSDFPAFKYIEKKDFMDIFGSYKYILDYDMVKIAFYKEEVVGFFISVPNYANLPYKLNVRNFFKILQIKNKPDEYVMLYMGVDRRHLGLGNALSNVITMELKNKHVPSIGALVRDGKITQSYASELIRDRYEYVLLEKKL